MGGADLKVECHSGFTHAERPIAIYLNDVRVPVREVLKEWRSPSGKHFRLLLENDEQVEVLYDESLEVWKEVNK